jgi:phenylacetate-coenzyme A ligase PaaK-like adenylate-forming protein
MSLNDLFLRDPFSFAKKEKNKLFNNLILDLNQFHYNNSKEYKKFINSLGLIPSDTLDYTNLPFLPINIFKYYDLYSVNKRQIIKTMTSSGTSGQKVSKINLDKETSINQTKVLGGLFKSIMGASRVPMIILDSESTLNNRNFFSARTAGILGFSIFASEKVFALNQDMELNVNLIQSFIKKHSGKKIFFYGFTYIVWEYFIKALSQKNLNFNLDNFVLIHGGGWKKMLENQVSNESFKKEIKNVLGNGMVHDYYGMVEQTGSINFECEEGFLHTSIYNDIIVRRPFDFSIAKKNEIGIIQTLSILPKSYPGISILTEDEGYLVGEDDCKCGRKGKYFKITGRVRDAEIRGCSDTFENE